MAEIKITKKKIVWPWVVLVLLLLGAFAYYLFATNRISDKAIPEYGTEEEETGALYFNDVQVNDSYVLA